MIKDPKDSLVQILLGVIKVSKDLKEFLVNKVLKDPVVN